MGERFVEHRRVGQAGPERPCGFDKAVCRHRNVAERCFHRLKVRFRVAP
jgi:transposase